MKLPVCDERSFVAAKVRWRHGGIVGRDAPGFDVEIVVVDDMERPRPWEPTVRSFGRWLEGLGLG